MPTFEVKLDTRDWERALRELGAVRGPIACGRALNKSIKSARTAMTKLIATDLGLKQATVREKLIITDANPRKLNARLSVSGKPIPLIEFKARGPEPSRGRGRGVTARLPAPGAGRYPNAFIATMRSGHRGVFQRRGQGRLPIRELHGPSLPHVFAKYGDEGAARAQEQLLKNVEHEINYELIKMSRGA